MRYMKQTVYHIDRSAFERSNARHEFTTILTAPETDNRIDTEITPTRLTEP